ncbi:MAG: hypothetical protein K5669_01320 [Lachnospiraceae bacterium]|nr:hypothetical protein [Lachnospiraceae bacterium]
MKIFISGSELTNNWTLSESVCSYIDGIISNQGEILIGDSLGMDRKVQKYLTASKYKNVMVYVSGSKSATRSNLGNWTEKHYPPNGRTRIAYQIEKNFHMAEDCDYGVFIWNGKSKGTFINMLYLCVQKKLCKLYLISEDRWMDIVSLEDLRDLAGAEGKITGEDISEVLTQCSFSDEMKCFLVTEEALSPFDLVDIISRAPITFEEKAALFRRLSSKRNIKHEAFISVEENVKKGRSFKTIKHDFRVLADCRGERTIWTVLYDRNKELQSAIEGLYSTVGDWYDNKPLVLFTEWYDTDEFHLKSSSCGLFTSLGAIEKYIENEEYDNDTGDGYYRVEAWDAYDVKWEYPRYDYYLYQGKICWFERLIPQKQEHGNTYFMPKDREFASGCLDLSFKTPYKPGDIVLIDCRPFGPPFHAMILEARDQWVCCFPNIVFKYPGTNEWGLTSLKHKRFYKDIGWHTYEPMLSPLYRLRRVREEEFTETDEQLMKLSKMVSESEEKAAKVWEKWNSAPGDSLSWEKVLEVFGCQER